jgi:hypothetical protein
MSLQELMNAVAEEQATGALLRRKQAACGKKPDAKLKVAVRRGKQQIEGLPLVGLFKKIYICDVLFKKIYDGDET